MIPNHRMVTTLVATTLMALSWGTLHAAENEPPQAELQPELVTVTKQGRVSAVRGLQGSVAQLTDEERKSWLLHGEHRRELLRTASHVIKVWGTPAPPQKGLPTLVVQRYALVSVGGKTPHVGVLMRDVEDRLWLDTGELVFKVTAANALWRRLKARVGCKVWLLGSVAENVVRTYRFDWLRCEDEANHQPTREKNR